MGWTDEGITSWETDELFLGPLWKISHILWKATQERGEVTKSGDFEAIDEPDYLSPLYNFGTLYDIDKYVIGRWSGVDEDQFGNTYISPFINYTDRDGNYDKEATKPARWNSATILTAIGRTEFIRIYDIVKLIIIPGILEADVPSQYLKPLIYDWVNQIYQLLNLFRWTEGILTFFNSFPADTAFKVKESQGVDYATAAAAWPANFSDEVRGTPNDKATSNQIGNVELSRQYCVDEGDHYYNSLTDKFFHEADIYPYIVKFGTFANMGDDVAENTYSKAVTYKKDEDRVLWSLYDNLDKYTGNVPPDYGAGTGNLGWQVDDDDGFALLRWDVEDGFEYVTELT